MRTTIYVDGYNLYYGSLRGTPYKWLNLQSLFAAVLSRNNEITAIKYFTARISSTASDPDKANHQDAYLRALKREIPELTIYFGQFTTHEVRAKLVTPIAGQRYADVSRTSEKGSDVNLAVHLVNDAWLGTYDCAVIVSGDSDLAEAMALVKAHHPQKRLGVIRTRSKGSSKELGLNASFVRYIPKAALLASQFPDVIPGTKIKKPPDW